MSKQSEQMKGNGKKSMKAWSAAGITVPIFWKAMIVIGILVATGSTLFLAVPAHKAGTAEMLVYKSPSCKCCDKWVDHMRDAGFKVMTRDSNNMDSIKSTYGVMPGLRSCHTAVVEGYVVEGHVPAGDIKRLLQERPVVVGLAVPGMPTGSPGMEGPYKDPYNIISFDRTGRTTVYARY